MSYMTPPAVEPRLSCEDYVNSKCMHCGIALKVIESVYGEFVWCNSEHCTEIWIGVIQGMLGVIEDPDLFKQQYMQQWGEL